MRNYVKKGLLFGIVFCILGCGEWTCAVDSETTELEPKMGGGPCEYNTYKGRATIVSIAKKDMPRGYGGPSYESYDVKFTFFTEEEIKETYGKVEGKEYTLKLTNSWYPGPRFLEKYGIEEGKSFECDLKVITKGTCSPIMFDFPDINLSDYFESKK